MFVEEVTAKAFCPKLPSGVQVIIFCTVESPAMAARRCPASMIAKMSMIVVLSFSAGSLVPVMWLVSKPMGVQAEQVVPEAPVAKSGRRAAATV